MTAAPHSLHQFPNTHLDSGFGHHLIRKVKSLMAAVAGSLASEWLPSKHQQGFGAWASTSLGAFDLTWASSYLGRKLDTSSRGRGPTASETSSGVARSTARTH